MKFCVFEASVTWDKISVSHIECKLCLMLWCGRGGWPVPDTSLSLIVLIDLYNGKCQKKSQVFLWYWPGGEQKLIERLAIDWHGLGCVWSGALCYTYGSLLEVLLQCVIWTRSQLDLFDNHHDLSSKMSPQHFLFKNCWHNFGCY